MHLLCLSCHDRLADVQEDFHDVSEAQLIELRRHWAESHSALAQRAKRDRDEIERLTKLLYEREKQSIRQFRAAAEGSSFTVPTSLVLTCTPTFTSCI